MQRRDGMAVELQLDGGDVTLDVEPDRLRSEGESEKCREEDELIHRAPL